LVKRIRATMCYGIVFGKQIVIVCVLPVSPDNITSYLFTFRVLIKYLIFDQVCKIFTMEDDKVQNINIF